MAARAVQAGQETAVDDLARNEVVLVGRVSGAPQERELPSGDALVSFRVVVARPPGQRSAMSGRRPPTIDTLDCVIWSAAGRRTARSLADGDVVAVEGALRRRFWRGATGTTSRTEVEVTSVRRLRRPKAAQRAARDASP